MGTFVTLVGKLLVPKLCLGTLLSWKLCFPLACKQSLPGKGVPNREIGNEGGHKLATRMLVPKLRLGTSMDSVK